VLAVATQCWPFAVTAGKLLDSCSLASAVDLDQRSDRRGVGPRRRYGLGRGFGVEWVVLELAGERGERVAFDLTHRPAQAEQEVKRGLARLAELGEMLALEAQVLLLQVGAERLGFGTQALPLLIACAPLRLLFRTRGVVGGARLV
jgi:hypothetical protein